MPMCVLGLLRCILFMFNGDGPEIVFVESGGVLISREIYASSMGWVCAKLVLKRKARFIRRLRSLARLIRIPNPGPFRFTKSCAEHLQKLLSTIDTKSFSTLRQGKYCCMQLLKLIQNIRIIYDLQGSFPDYFSASLPTWFRYELIAPTGIYFYVFYLFVVLISFTLYYYVMTDN